MKRSIDSRFTGLLVAIAGSALLCACGSEKKESVTVEQEPPETVKQDDQQAPEPDAPKPGKDPIFGLWKVVDASGNFADVNKGMKWEFLPEGKAVAHSLRVDPERKVRVSAKEDPPDAGVPVQRHWTWKRVAPDRIEMKHPDSPRVAEIKHAIEGDTMQFEWLTGSQKFVMKRVEERP